MGVGQVLQGVGSGVMQVGLQTETEGQVPQVGTGPQLVSQGSGRGQPVLQGGSGQLQSHS